MSTLRAEVELRDARLTGELLRDNNHLTNSLVWTSTNTWEATGDQDTLEDLQAEFEDLLNLAGLNGWVTVETSEEDEDEE